MSGYGPGYLDLVRSWLLGRTACTCFSTHLQPARTRVSARLVASSVVINLSNPNLHAHGVEPFCCESRFSQGLCLRLAVLDGVALGWHPVSQRDYNAARHGRCV